MLSRSVVLLCLVRYLELFNILRVVVALEISVDHEHSVTNFLSSKDILFSMEIPNFAFSYKKRTSLTPFSNTNFNYNITIIVYLIFLFFYLYFFLCTQKVFNYCLNFLMFTFSGLKKMCK